MKSALTAAIILFITVSVTGQHYTWVKRAGSTAEEKSPKLLVTPSGESLLAGNFSGSIGFSGNVIYIPRKSGIYLVKYRSDGTLAWTTSAYSNNFSSCKSITTDPAGNIFLCGQFSDTLFFGTSTVISQGPGDAWFAKFDANGKFLWVKTYSLKGEEEATAIALSPGKGIYITGYILDSLTLGGDSVYHWLVDKPFTACYDTAGNLQWTDIGSGHGRAEGKSISTSNAGDIWVTGSLFDTMTFQGKKLSGGQTFILKYNQTGKLIHAVSAGGFNPAFQGGEGSDIKTDNEGHTVVAGYFSGPAIFDTIPVFGSQTKGSDAFVAVYDTSLHCNWVKTFGGDGLDFISAISILNSGLVPEIILTGEIQLPAQIDSLSFADTSGGRVFVADYSINGNFLWAYILKSKGSAEGTGIGADVKGNVYVTGDFDDSMYFDSTVLFSMGNTDIFLAKFSRYGLSIPNQKLAPAEIRAFPNPSNGIVTIKTSERIKQVECFNSLGEEIYPPISGPENNHINFTKESNGLYYLKIKTKSSIENVKILIRH